MCLSKTLSCNGVLPVWIHRVYEAIALNSGLRTRDNDGKEEGTEDSAS